MKLVTIWWWEAVIIAVAVVSPVSAQTIENSANKAPDSYEFKVLLKNDRFDKQNRDPEINAVLERLRQNAELQGAEVDWKEPGEREITQREVRFLDTSADLEQAKIFGQGVVFRTRVQMVKPCDSEQADACKPEKYKVTLKQRFNASADVALFKLTPNLNKAKAFSDQVAKHEPKFEEDYSWKTSEDESAVREFKIMRSLSSSVEIKDLQGREQIRDYTTAGDIMAVFDQVPWDWDKVQADTGLQATCQIESTKIDVGKLTWELNSGEKIKCDTSFTFWNKESDRSPLASEFSYACKDKQKVFGQVKDAVTKVFKQLINDEFVNSEPDTKTRIAYRCAPR